MADFKGKLFHLYNFITLFHQPDLSILDDKASLTTLIYTKLIIREFYKSREKLLHTYFSEWKLCLRNL